MIKLWPVNGEKKKCKDERGLREIAMALNGIAAAIQSANPEAETVRFDYEVGPALPKRKEHNMLTVEITNSQKVNVKINPVTARGKPAKVDGAPVWSVVSGDSTLIVAPDGLSADLVSSDLPGETTFLVDADADLGAGVIDLQDNIVLTVVGENAAALGLVAGTAVDK